MDFIKHIIKPSMGYLHLIVMLFIALLSTRMRYDPSFLGANKDGTEQGQLLSLT